MTATAQNVTHTELTVNRKFKEIRKHFHLSQTDMAERLKLGSSQRICNIEREVAKVTIAELMAAAKAFDISPIWFLYE